MDFISENKGAPCDRWQTAFYYVIFEDRIYTQG